MQIERLFTANQPVGDESLGSPKEDRPLSASWSREALEAFSQAFSEKPCACMALEENTVPSKLWRHRAEEKQGFVSEKEPEEVFSRVVGHAAYQGWKKGLIEDEAELRVFYDETFALLSGRFIALDLQSLHSFGLSWAYGSAETTHPAAAVLPKESFVDLEEGRFSQTSSIEIRNRSFDALLSGKPSRALRNWGNLLKKASFKPLSVRFADTHEEWDVSSGNGTLPSAMIDLLAFRRPEGGLDTAKLRQAVRLTVLLFDLSLGENNETRSLALGPGNLAAYLMAEAIPYDSEAGRAVAGAAVSFLAAEATLISAELAGILGPCPALLANREKVLRAVRNRRRASYGEKNDYERLSIPPTSVEAGVCADLIVLSNAQHAWDLAEELVHKNGVRHLNLTSIFSSPFFSAFLETSSQGIEPELALVREKMDASESFRKEMLPALKMGLIQKGLSPLALETLERVLTGHKTLREAPGLDWEALQEKGFTEEALERVEAYLPQVHDIRFAFTPWILGEAFCLQKLKVPEEKLEDFGFDLLSYLGFSEKAIEKANLYVCGTDTLAFSGLEDSSCFSTRHEIDPTALVKMAGAVQSFVSDDVVPTLTVASKIDEDKRAELVLLAWREGLKGLRILSSAPETSIQTENTVRPLPQVRSKKLLHAHTPKVTAPLPQQEKKTSSLMQAVRAGKSKASLRTLSAKKQTLRHPNGTNKRG